MAELDAVVFDGALRQSLVAARELGRAGLRVGVVECESTRFVPAFASRWITARADVPDRDTHPDRMVDAMLELLDESSARVAFPIHDGTIDAVQQRRGDFEQRAAIALGSKDAVEAASDKEATLRIAANIGLRVPRALRIDDVYQVDRALDEIGLPAVAKPTRSWVVANGETHRLSPVIVTSLGQAATAVHELRVLGSDVLLQEWIPGAREAVSFVFAYGNYYGEFAQVATRMTPILGGNSVMRESIPLRADLRDTARRLIAAIGLEGYSEVEFRRDRNDTPVLMEINPRLSASVGVAVRAGINFPRLLAAWACSEPMPRGGASNYRVGQRMRWLGGDLRWLADNLRFRDHPDAIAPRRALTMFVKDFAVHTGYDYLERDDLRPALVATARAVSGARDIAVARWHRKWGKQ